MVTTEAGFDTHLLVHFLLKSKEDRIYSCGHRYTLSGSPVISLANVNLVATQLADGFATDFCNCLTSAETFVGTHVSWYSSTTMFEGFSSSAAVPGVVATNQSLPEEDCVVIRKRTGLAGRTHRGRIFVPLVPETLQDDGRLTPAGITAYLGLAYKFKTQWTFDGDLLGMIGTPKHAAWQAGTLDTIHETGLVVDVLNRRDRRNPKTMIYQASPA